TIMPGEHATLFFYYAPSSFLEALMFALSFPLGDAAVFLLHSPTAGTTERLAFWTLAMVLGYAQWFHLFPALLRRRDARATTLNLSGGGGVALGAGAPLGLASAETRAPDEEQRPPVPQFNERGLTPLERILREEE
ncbi:MAG TPA: hypothetical protein VE642_03085, partial [Pyrinomonadaceae bacterium]|nr:hypothetical protein [Pyrinomonadaceae bacterium]